MTLALNAHEARVLGVLVEKAFTTPDQYPLTLNATTNGCNQKSNRDPVVEFSQNEVGIAFQGLRDKHLVGASFPAGGRAEKWHHNAREALGLADKPLAVLTEMLVRGPQTAGELRTRATRMSTIADLDELAQAVEVLIDKGYARRLPPRSGSRAERFGQTFCGELHPDGPQASEPAAARSPASAIPSATSAPRADRVADLESRVERVERRLAELAERLGEPLGD